MILKYDIPSVSYPPRSFQLSAGRSRRRLTEKRAFDIGVTLIMTPVWFPVLILILLAVKLDEPTSPAIFRQWRVGLGGKYFRIIKVRTMVPKAEAIQPLLAARNEVGGPQFKMQADPRVTPLGRILRKTHLDELPQLFNVLAGDMSLVGPRPSVAPVKVYQDWWKSRLLCRPGLTGLWQVRRRPNGDFDDRARLDIAYLRNRSLRFDVRILIETLIVAFIRRSGA